MRKLQSILLIIGLLSFIMISSVAATPDPLANIRVIPVGSTETGAARITESPADLVIYVTTAAHSPTTNVWLIIVLNKPTYDAISTITAVGAGVSVTFDKARFMPANPVDGKIPPIAADGTYDPTYPGCGKEERYEVSACGSNMFDRETDDLYYGYKFFKDSITTTPYAFTVTLNFATPVDPPGIAALVLANGVTPKAPTTAFDIKTPFSGSTLVVPELASVLLMMSLFTGAFGLYAMRRKK